MIRRRRAGGGIDVFGVSFPSWWGGYLPMIYSNGGQLASDDGQRLMLNGPEAVEALQALQVLRDVVVPLSRPALITVAIPRPCSSGTTSWDR